MKPSSYRGVTIERGRWKAQIGYEGKTHHIGTFDTDEEAARAYDREAIRVHGAKAQCNFPVNGGLKAKPKMKPKRPKAVAAAATPAAAAAAPAAGTAAGSTAAET